MNLIKKKLIESFGSIFPIVAIILVLSLTLTPLNPGDMVLFLIGAPLGSIVRKGGLGLPLVASVIFFVLYYVINTICIKAIREVALPPYGMWISTVAMLPLGIFLTLKATTDSSVFDKGTWRKMILRIFVRSKKKQEIR